MLAIYNISILETSYPHLPLHTVHTAQCPIPFARPKAKGNTNSLMTTAAIIGKICLVKCGDPSDLPKL